MSQEVEGVDFFTSDLIRRTRARKKRLEKELGQEQQQSSADQTDSDFVFDENLGQIVRKKTSSAGDIVPEPPKPKSPIRQLSPVKSVLTSNRLSHISASPSIPYIDKSSSDSLPAAPTCSPSQSSTGSSTSDLPRYKVEIPSRFSPVKKTTSRKFSPVVTSKTTVTTSLHKLPSASSASVPASGEKTSSPVRKSPKPILEKFKVMREEAEKQATSELSKSVPDVPVSSIRGRIQKLEQVLALHASAEPAAPAPETLSLRHKKVLFEKKIRAEAVQKDAGIKRNEYLAQKRGRSASQMPVTSPGIVAKMQQKILTGQHSNEIQQEPDLVTEHPLHEPSSSPEKRNKRGEVAVMSKSPAAAVNEFDRMNEESALAAFFDIEHMDGDPADANEMDLDHQNPYLTNAQSGPSPPPSPDGADAMSMCTQSSQSDKEFDSLPSSPSKSSSGSSRMYPELPDEKEEAHPSSPKKLRFCDQVLHEPAAVPTSSEVTPLRTLSRYRLEQRQRQNETPVPVPKVVFQRTATTLQSQDRLEADRKSELRRQLHFLKNEEIPRCEILIRQSIQALKACLVSDYRETLSHADAERHVLVSKMKRVAALNQIQFLTSQITTSLTSESIAGHLTIQRIDLPIMRDAVLAHKKGLNTKSPETQFYFCVASCGPVVHSTECLPFAAGYSSGYLSFNLHAGFAFPDLRQDFELRFEVFEVTLVKQSKKESSRAMRLTPRKQHQNQAPAADRDEEQQVAVSKGVVMINVRNIKKKDFDLQNFRFESSLQGSVRIGMAVAAEYKNDYSNFLNFYDEKVDIGTWKRRWCHLKGPVIRFWRLPEDEESEKKPLGEIDLRHCINPSIEPAPFDVCPRKESFVLVFAGTASDKTRLRVNWLVNKNYRDVIERKLVAADVVEERDEWISVLSDVLSGMRVWDEEALIPCTSTDIQSYIHI